jgi:hypothetical protein
MARILFLPPNQELEGAVVLEVVVVASLLGRYPFNLVPSPLILSVQLSSAGGGYVGAGAYVGIGAGAASEAVICPPRLLALLCLVNFFGIYNIR